MIQRIETKWRGKIVIAVLACAGVTVSVTQTLAVPLIGQLPAVLHTTASSASWAITATLLCGALANPVVGRLGDMYGKRRMMLASVALLIVGSAVCALANSVVPMVVGRALQGCAMGIVPLAMSVMRDELPAEEVGSGIALMGSSLGIGGTAGLPVAALVAQTFDWRVLFWVCGAVGAVVLALILLLVPESPVRTGGRFDLLGAVGLSGGLGCLLLMVSKGGDWGWTSFTTFAFLATSVVVLFVWAVWELRTPDPLVDLHTTLRRPVLLTNAASVMVGFAMYAMTLIVPQLVQLPSATGHGLGGSMVVAGLCLAPGGLVMLLFAPLAARLSAAHGPRASLMVGSGLMGLSYVMGLGMTDTIWQVVTISTVVAGGIAFAYASLPALIMAEVPQSKSAAANGLNSLMRSIGTSTASAVVGVVLARMTVPYGASSVPSLAGFRTGFLIATAAALVAIGIGMCLPGRRRQGPASGSKASGVGAKAIVASQSS
ncbi:MFS transporter [Streptomyces sp. TP-A0874]|uniref:MFS transporter n=1 Tax=Streptomyces sp. TP-A0874 TaxID=549819 RepID=UPI000A807176|nr:MFS transporter [Streptomyces sp. TP-A0874]